MEEPTMSGTGHIEMYRDTQGETRWRAVAGNGEEIADSAEGYTTATDAGHGLDVLADLLRGNTDPTAGAPGEVEVRVLGADRELLGTRLMRLGTAATDG
jgi:uncharacterized protein YegP (UPF0339 family)